tara:strand:+ start:11976 stop:14405 length:2430 start_codon:yes stop_codon:yes gene_type:complete
MKRWGLFKQRKETLINPRIKNLNDMSPFVDLSKQPALGIVTRAYYRASDLKKTRATLGETPILNAIKMMEKQQMPHHEQLRIIHGLDQLGNMYTQHPDRLIPFWLRCKEMNLTQLLLTMMQFPDSPPLTLRPIITQCYMDIIRNLHDIDRGVPLDDAVESSSEAEFVAFRRAKDIDIHVRFLETTFKIWAARIVHNESSQPLMNRSELIRELMKDSEKQHALSRQFWLVDELSSPSMQRTSIWHDTDTTISSKTHLSFMSSIVNQLYYGARLVSEYLPKTGFDVDPKLPTLSNDQVKMIDLVFNKIQPYLPNDFVKTSSHFKNLQRGLIIMNDHIKNAKYRPLNLTEMNRHCEKIVLAKDISMLLADINPDRYGILGYLIHQLHIYLSVTARIRESDVVNNNASCKNDKRQPIIQQCFDLWKSISNATPVHLTIADFGSVNMSECIRLSFDLKPSKDSVVFALPERVQDTQQFIHLLKSRPPAINEALNSIGVLLGKSDAIKRSRAPFYTFALNLSLGRLIRSNQRYIGNGSSIIRGGTLTHLTWANLGHTFGYGKTVQQGDSFRSVVNEYYELIQRANGYPDIPSIFEIISMAIGPASSQDISNYQDQMAMAIAKGALESYPKEASRSHFKHDAIKLDLKRIMSNQNIHDRAQQIKRNVLPYLRAIPEANMAMNYDLYPVNQDAKVSHWYYDLLTKHRKTLRMFYSGASTLPSHIPQTLSNAFINHKISLSKEDLLWIQNEISGDYTPPMCQYAIDMVGDTLRQIPQTSAIRTPYEHIFCQLHLRRQCTPPAYIHIGEKTARLTMQAI